MKEFLRNIYNRFFRIEDDFFSIYLELEKGIHLLSSEYGKMLAATQVVPLIEDHKKIKVFFPEHIKVANSTFLGGFMREILSEDKDFEISISADNDVLLALSKFYNRTEAEVRESVEAKKKEYDRDLDEINKKANKVPG